MVKRLSKHKRRKILRYIYPQIPHPILLDFPEELWKSYKRRAGELGLPLFEFLRRERLINLVIGQQLTSMDPQIAAQGGNTKKPGPERIERIFSHLDG